MLQLFRSTVNLSFIRVEVPFPIINIIIATGGTAKAAAKLVEISKSKVSAFVFVINLFDLSLNLLSDGLY